MWDHNTINIALRSGPLHPIRKHITFRKFKAVDLENFSNDNEASALDCLMENKEKVLAEAGPSRFWASGMSPFITENCAPTYWPGQNMLRALY